ncbi:hypothetical protein QYE76_003965 [Lolium multiflorum]|uniref:Protein SMG7 n=1 Tax=Lolium multiflorum TaxID=4521 RepID=A0AAD8RRB8_LOLMU|nr:hypothetical protein QYE76_003965 [Lolium multiflorum]
MMTVPMDTTAAPPPHDLAKRLFKKNAELKSLLEKSAQSKVPSDPNIWLQMRENFEKMILADHDFCEKHEIEYILWQLHYKRIEEFRHHISTAGSAAAQNGKSSASAERIKRIKSAFRGFLSEASGFYHDLMFKIKSTYGLPVGYFSESPDSAKNDKKAADVKKALVSCHRCLIYLGDLARYKGMFGDGDSATREYAAASSYYKEAASICPSSGNPHHQLAILASYSSNEVVAVYRYFRSLAVDTPFSTARDNLILAFEKNRQSYAQLPSNNKVATARTLPPRSAGRGRGRGEIRFQPKDVNTEAASKEREQSMPDTLKSFFVRFVRLNGILFTRTSLETFEELFDMVRNDLKILLSSGPNEELNFGSDAAENALAMVRLVAILIFTVHNVRKEPDSQSYAEIVQRRVLLQNAFTAAFEFVGRILKRCSELRDIASSFYLPAIVVYIEWLACHPELAADSEMDEKHANARSFFWNQCVSLMNKLILTNLASFDCDDDEACFFDMGVYEEGETGNRLALWEDFELRGFLPLVPAQLILDFSSKHTFGNDGSTKEKKARAQRILSAGKALLSFVQIDQLRIFFDPSSRKFVLAKEPPVFEAAISTRRSSNAPAANAVELEHETVSRFDAVAANVGAMQAGVQLCSEGEDDEEIVFKPTASEKFPKVLTEQPINGYIQPVQMSTAGWPTIAIQSTASVSAPGNGNVSGPLPMSSVGWAPNGVQEVIPSNVPISSPYEFVQPVGIPTSSWASNGAPLVGPLNTIPAFSGVVSDPRVSASMVPQMNGPDYLKSLFEQEKLLMMGLNNVNLAGNGFLDQRFQGGLSGLQSMGYSPHVSVESGRNNASLMHNQAKANEETIPSTSDSIVPSVAASGGVTMKLTDAPETVSKKNPVSRPSRPVGPPPGFNHVTPKRHDDFASLGKLQHQQIDDYSWLDGYQPSMDYVHNARAIYPDVSTTTSAFTPPFPFPGKQQVSGVHAQTANEKTWQDFHLFDPAKQNMVQNHQQINQQSGQVAEKQPAKPIGSGRYLV